jgi:hypothetical protein
MNSPRRNLPRFRIGVGVNLTEACPPLAGFTRLWRDFIMEPEAGVPARRGFSEGGSALVFHHPDATYFGVGEASN